MTVQAYIFDQVVLPAGAATQQGTAAPTGGKRVIASAALVNTTAAGIVATVYLVPSGGTANAATTVISARTIAPGETYFCPELINRGLNAGGSVWASGSGLSFGYAAKDIYNG